MKRPFQRHVICEDPLRNSNRVSGCLNFIADDRRRSIFDWAVHFLQGALPGCLAGIQAEWFDRTELESEDRSARSRIETRRLRQGTCKSCACTRECTGICHYYVDVRHDVRSAKLQACMKSAKNQHTWHASSSEQSKRFKRPGTEWATTTQLIEARADNNGVNGLAHGLNRNQLVGREWSTTTGRDRARSFGRDVTWSLHSNCCLKLMHLWSNPQPMRNDHSIAGTTILQTTLKDADDTQFYWW